MKKIIIALMVILSLTIFVPGGKTQMKSYYDGDAIYYHGQLIVASTNTESLEVFRLSGDNLVLVSKFRPLEAKYNRYGSFYNVKLREESGRLYAYAVTDFAVNKYDLTDLNSKPALVQQMTNTYWEYYQKVDQIGGKLATYSAKAVRVYNSDLQVVDSYNFTNETPHNIQANQTGRFLVDLKGNKARIYDLESRQIIREIPVNFKTEIGRRKAVFDPETNDLFIVDDFYAKKFNFKGELQSSFRHLEYPGYDFEIFGPYVYFSNGTGVVKLKKEDMSLVASKRTGSFGGNGWAMGIKIVGTDNGDKLVVFNNSSIVVLNANLNKEAVYKMTETVDEKPAARENLWLRVDKNHAAVNSDVVLTGGGFVPNEIINIDFAGRSIIEVTTDNNGRFSKTIKVPEITEIYTSKVDIRSTGKTSKLSYSISFTVEK